MWEKEKLLVMSNLSFSHSVFKRLLLQALKNQGLFGKGLKWTSRIWYQSFTKFWLLKNAEWKTFININLFKTFHIKLETYVVIEVQKTHVVLTHWEKGLFCFV